MEHETTSHISPDLLYRREQAVQDLGFAALRLTQANEAYHHAIAEILELNQLIRNEEQS
jgi:hypothetical protein